MHPMPQMAEADTAVLATAGMAAEQPRDTIRLVVQVISSMDQVCSADAVTHALARPHCGRCAALSGPTGIMWLRHRSAAPAQVSAEDWDACAMGDGTLNPFLLHAFLLALETSRSAVTFPTHCLPASMP